MQRSRGLAGHPAAPRKSGDQRVWIRRTTGAGCRTIVSPNALEVQSVGGRLVGWGPSHVVDSRAGRDVG